MSEKCTAYYMRKMARDHKEIEIASGKGEFVTPQPTDWDEKALRKEFGDALKKYGQGGVYVARLLMRIHRVARRGGTLLQTFLDDLKEREDATLFGNDLPEVIRILKMLGFEARVTRQPRVMIEIKWSARLSAASALEIAKTAINDNKRWEKADLEAEVEAALEKVRQAASMGSTIASFNELEWVTFDSKKTPHHTLREEGFQEAFIAELQGLGFRVEFEEGSDDTSAYFKIDFGEEEQQ